MTRKKPRREKRHIGDGPCQGKKKYGDHASAEIARGQMMQRHRFELQAGEGFGEYRCPECGWWHLGRRRA